MRVLLVQEDPRESDWIQRTLGEAGLLPSLRLTSARGVKHAIAQLCPDEGEPAVAGGAGMPQLLLLDLKGCDGDPLELVRCMRGDPRTRRIPIVAFGTPQELIEACYEAGVNSVVHRPEDRDDFADTLKATISYWTRFNEAPSP